MSNTEQLLQIPLDLLHVARDKAVPLGLAVTAYVVWRVANSGKRAKGLPPGPPTVPVLGNLLVFPRTFPHFQFTEWAKEYGDIFSLKLMDKTILVLNSPSAFKEVIDRRAQSNSNRPASILADMITPNNMNMGTCHHADETWKVMRRASMQLLNNENLKKYRPFQHAEATQLMWEFAHEPENWYVHVNRFTTSFALGIIYGIRAPRKETRDCAAFLHVHPQFMHALELGTMPPVDLFPSLNWVPARWAGWKRTVEHIRQLHETLYYRLLGIVEKRVKDGNATDVFMEEALARRKEWELEDDVVMMNLGGTLLEGSDTTSASIQSQVLILTAFPEAQRKLHEEMDRVVGRDRAPSWEDIPNLPYLQAFIEECHRFRPVAPLALPHEMCQDEVVNGMILPKDAALFVNLWAIFHDPRYFDQPDEFIPERFLKHPFGIRPDVEDDPGRRVNLLFGGGRRVCPGMHFAMSSLQINLANFVWAFNLLPALDASGHPVTPDLNNVTTGITAVPKPFACRIVPRAPGVVDAIDAQFAKAAEHLMPFEKELDPEDRKWNSMWRDA